MDKNSLQCIQRITGLGVSLDDALALRRISMTLQRWFEQECGDSNDYASWCITRGHKPKREHYRDPETQRSMWRDVGEFQHADDGKPYIERHIHSENKARYESIPDRETGALKRLNKIMAQYPALGSYVQGDPRGASLYIVRHADVPEFGSNPDSYYSRGVAVHK